MKTNRIKLMSEAPVSKALFQLGIPMVISMLVTALYNVADTYTRFPLLLWNMGLVVQRSLLCFRRLLPVPSMFGFSEVERVI